MLSQGPVGTAANRYMWTLSQTSRFGIGTGSASNAAGDGGGRAWSGKAGFQPYRGKLAVRDEQRGGGNVGRT